VPPAARIWEAIVQLISVPQGDSGGLLQPVTRAGLAIAIGNALIAKAEADEGEHG